jgi:hypothetical protein
MEEVQIFRDTVDGIAVPTKYINMNRKFSSTPGCICSPTQKNIILIVKKSNKIFANLSVFVQFSKRRDNFLVD